MPVFLTMRQLRESVVDWSDDTIKRKIKNDGFPAIQDEGGRYLFPTDKVMDWFKRRTVQAV